MKNNFSHVQQELSLFFLDREPVPKRNLRRAYIFDTKKYDQFGRVKPKVTRKKTRSF